MRLRVSRLLPVVGVVCAAWCCGGTVPADQLPSAEALSVALTTLDGNEVRLSDRRGEVVLADFWATWCAPCRAQHKVLEELYPEYRDQPVQFVAVNVGESADLVRSFVEDEPFSYPVWLDATERLSNNLRIVGLPSLMVVDAAGEIRFLRFGVTGKAALRREIETALGGVGTGD